MTTVDGQDRENDPLWYDRVEAEVPAPRALQGLATAFVVAVTVYRLPEDAYQLCASQWPRLRRTWRTLVRDL